jgi:hypothetical protein
MAAYYFDCEFLEGTQKEKFPISLFRKNTPPTIDLISIGIVSDDNREYYAISKDFNLDEAWNRRDVKTDDYGIEEKVYCIRENVLRPIFNEWINEYNGKIVRLGLPITGWMDNQFNKKNFKKLLKVNGKTNKQIAEEVKDFVYSNGDISMHRKFTYEHLQANNININFYGYYSAYDHVALCWIFGKMIDLPSGFPMYTRDLKQMLDEKVELKQWYYHEHILVSMNTEKDRPATFEEKLERLKKHQDYPKETNAHNALADAKWNKELHEFIKSL